MRKIDKDFLETVIQQGLTSSTNIEELKKLIAKKELNVDIQNEDGNTPLHMSCINRDRTTMAILIELGANVNLQNTYGETPLHFTLYSDNIITAKILIEAGADCSIKNDEGYTPLDCCDYHEEKLIKAYIKYLCMERIYD